MWVRRKFSSPRKRVLTQISTGTVRISFGELRQLAPPGTFTAENDRDRTLIELPLQEILGRINPGLFMRRPAQRQVDVPDEVVGPFGGQSPVAITSQGKGATAGAPPARNRPAGTGPAVPPSRNQPPQGAPLSSAPLSAAPRNQPPMVPKSPIPRSAAGPAGRAAGWQSADFCPHPSAHARAAAAARAAADGRARRAGG